jgi:hypothetical protein
MRAYLLACGLAALGGCFGTNTGGGSFDNSDPTCTTNVTVPIDTGATLTHEAGVNPGYYPEYDGSGAWHLEWTCDTDLSDYGCEFEGTITVPTPASGDVGATCYKCEADDQMSTDVSGANTEIVFDTETSTGLDGVDFTSDPGARIVIDLKVNDLYQDDLVFIPSQGAPVSPTCLPITLAPTTP